MSLTAAVFQSLAGALLRVGTAVPVQVSMAPSICFCMVSRSPSTSCSVYTSSESLSRESEPSPILCPLSVPAVMLSALRFVTVMLEASIVPAVSLFAETSFIIALVMAPSFTVPLSIHALLTLAMSALA